MTASPPSGLNNKMQPYLVLLAAAVFLLLLLLTIKPGVFFSGDGGMKYLVTKQLAHSHEFKYIVSSHPQWVKNIWAEGYYPFTSPFIYTDDNGHMVAFPAFFEMLSSFFYTHFGYYGLYIIPALSVFLIWFSFLNVAFLLKLRPTTITLGLLLLAFCSPLTFYGAVYWEHSLATLLIFNAVIYFVREKPSMRVALINGFLAGASIWFREEAIILLGLVLLVVCWNNRRFKSMSDSIFVGSATIPVAFFFLFNHIMYGSMFGLHGTQIIKSLSVASQSWNHIRQFFRLNIMSIKFFPIIGFCLLIILFLIRQRKERSSHLFQLLFIIMLYMVIAPFLLPSDGDKQWGPRFFLVLVPPAALALTMFINRYTWEQCMRKYRALAALCVLLVAYSMYLNVYKAAGTLKGDYAKRVYPALQYIQQEECSNIIVDNQYITQELTETFHSKNFFLLADKNKFATLLEKLKQAGQQECVLISIDKDKSCFPEWMMNNSNIEWKKSGSYYMTEYPIPENLLSMISH